MAKKKSLVSKNQTNSKNHVVDTESEFAAEFGEGLYGGQARKSYQQQKNKRKNQVNK